jgi:catechol 2,3-dioxygenase-like lactoylglutathione lyase family enzyme
VPDPDAAAAFYADVLGCEVVLREPDCIEVVSGALRLFLLRDPVRTHDAVVASLDVTDRAAAVRHLQSALS